MKKLLLLLALAVCAALPAARAQWQTTTFNLKGGWKLHLPAR